MEEIERKFPEYNLNEVIQFITKKETLLYEVITTNTNKEPYIIYNTFGLDILTILFLQLRYGLRICELLRASCRHITDCRTLALPGAKHSRFRLVEIPYQHPSLLQACRCGRHALFPVSYKQVWRVYNQLALTAPPRRGGTYRAITQIGRIRFIAEMKQNLLPPEGIRDLIGHKSTKSQTYYLKRSN